MEVEKWSFNWSSWSTDMWMTSYIKLENCNKFKNIYKNYNQYFFQDNGYWFVDESSFLEAKKIGRV